MDSEETGKPYADLGRVFKAARIRENFTQRDVGKLTGIPLGTYRDYEQGRCCPDGDRTVRIMVLLKIDLTELNRLVPAREPVAS